MVWVAGGGAGACDARVACVVRHSAPASQALPHHARGACTVRQGSPRRGRVSRRAGDQAPCARKAGAADLQSASSRASGADRDASRMWGVRDASRPNAGGSRRGGLHHRSAQAAPDARRLRPGTSQQPGRRRNQPPRAPARRRAARSRSCSCSTSRPSWRRVWLTCRDTLGAAMCSASQPLRPAPATP